MLRHAILSRAITLVESNAAAHFEMAQQVIQKLLPYTGKSTRVGITGVPGAGKSTFIEALGTNLCRSVEALDKKKAIRIIAFDLVPTTRQMLENDTIAAT